MAKRIGYLQGLFGGISQSKKIGPANSFSFGHSIDFRNEPTEITINPRSASISGSTVVDLPMWMDVAGDLLYAYGSGGNVYQIGTTDLVTNEYTIPDSVGNGMGYLAEDRYLYLASNTSLSRRSTATATGTYYANFLENEGGAPTNTRSIDFEASSSMSATRADTASLSITGDITLEAFVKPESMPTGSNTMALISKWDESGTKRSYKMSFVTTSNAFGDGSDGSLTISSDTTETPIDSACSGTSGSTSLSATNASFASGQVILIHQTIGSGYGTRQITKIASYTAGTITTEDALSFSFSSSGSNRAQVRVLKQYTNVTVNSGKTYTAKPWNGTVGGILSFMATGTVSGAISAVGCGLRGASSPNGSARASGKHGEGYNGGYDTVATSKTNNAHGGGGAYNNGADAGSGGGGGGYGVAGSAGVLGHPTGGSGPGLGGTVAGGQDLTASLVLGGGGGSGSNSYNYDSDGGRGGAGGAGGGCIYIIAPTISISGSASGNNGSASTGHATGGGGAGSGGSILLQGQTVTLGTGTITSAGGTGGSGGAFGLTGGAGGAGRIHVDYYTTYTGSTSPTAYFTQNNSLGATSGYALRFYVSSTGLNSETYTQAIDDPTGQWNRFSIAWDASDSKAYFYRNGDLLGTRTGALTAIHDNTSIFGLATYVSSGGSNTDFYDGLMDDVRVWNDIRTASEIMNYNREVLTGSEGNLVAYYKLDSAVTDSQTSGNNNLTANNSPTYSTDIPFYGVTTRLDQDVAIAGSGQTYTLTTAVNEGATHRQTFTPTKEPLKSLALTIGSVGTGNWTVVVHDELNRTLVSTTVANADLVAGVYEFRFTTVGRPVLNASYHVHVYSTVADGTVATSVASDLEGAYLRTYFQVLVSDIYHPIKQFTNFLVIGNERYVAKLEAGSVYNPHRLTLPSGYRVRCFAFWRDYIAIGTWQGDDVSDVDSAKILFWDGTSDTYVEPLDVPQGAINAMFGKQGKLLISAGYRGQFLEYTGGEEASPVFRIPLAERSDNIEIAPGGMCMWQGIIQIGGVFDTDSTTIHEGVYTWGRIDASDPVSFGLDYPLSLGDQISPYVKIASLLPRGKKLYIGYQSNASYGIDVVDQEADPYGSATIELLNTDLQNVASVKYPLTFRVDFLPLVDGQSITLKYKPDRSNTWYEIQTQDTAGATEIAGSINQRVKEVQFAVDITTNGSQVTIINFAFEAEDAGAKAMRYVK